MYECIFNVGEMFVTGYELRLWRSGQYSSRSIRTGHWRQEDAAEQLGVAFRTYCYYEKNGPSRMVILGTQTLSLQVMLPELEKLPLPHV
ncbi:hypothetical protein KKI93_24840, partial [Xenorhabdus bovienii]|nr:hypothetical protein [Xenorhabdus bovienii]